MAHEIKLPHWQAYVTPTDDGRAFIEWRAIVAGHQVAVELERDGPHDMLSLFVDGRCVWTEVAPQDPLPPQDARTPPGATG